MNYKCINYIALLLNFFITVSSLAQESKARIENISFEPVEMEGTKVVVYYDIVNSSPVERFEIELAFVDDEDFYYYPKSTTAILVLGSKAEKRKK